MLSSVWLLWPQVTVPGKWESATWEWLVKGWPGVTAPVTVIMTVTMTSLLFTLILWQMGWLGGGVIAKWSLINRLVPMTTQLEETACVTLLCISSHMSPTPSRHPRVTAWKDKLQPNAAVISRIWTPLENGPRVHILYKNRIWTHPI